jgi:hypothetical protein
MQRFAAVSVPAHAKQSNLGCGGQWIAAYLLKGKTVQPSWLEISLLTDWSMATVSASLVSS